MKLLCSIDRKSVLGFRDFLLYTMLYRLGLRIGEAVGIDMKNIDFEKEILHVHGKGRRERKLPLLPEIMELIRTWLMYRGRLCGAARLDALFVSKKGNRLSIRAAQDNLQKAVAKAGPFSIDKVTPHALRHAFATHAIEGEQDIIVLKAIMGHACMSSTEIYLHSFRLKCFIFHRRDAEIAEGARGAAKSHPLRFLRVLCVSAVNSKAKHLTLDRYSSELEDLVSLPPFLKKS